VKNEKTSEFYPKLCFGERAKNSEGIFVIESIFCLFHIWEERINFAHQLGKR
jgi:hypothetical protein